KLVGLPAYGSNFNKLSGRRRQFDAFGGCARRPARWRVDRFFIVCANQENANERQRCGANNDEPPGAVRPGWRKGWVVVFRRVLHGDRMKGFFTVRFRKRPAE